MAIVIASPRGGREGVQVKNPLMRKRGLSVDLGLVFLRDCLSIYCAERVALHLFPPTVPSIALPLTRPVYDALPALKEI